MIRNTPTVAAFALALTALPAVADGLAFEPVAPEGISAERAANVEKFQQSISGDQLAAMQAQGYGAFGAIAIPVAKPGNPVTVATLADRDAARAAALDACKDQTGTDCTLIGYIVPADG